MVYQGVCSEECMVYQGVCHGECMVYQGVPIEAEYMVSCLCKYC